MASYVSLGQYNATMKIPEFKGLLQYGDGLNADPRYSPDAVNAETKGGVLQPVAACELLPPALGKPIETLARLHRRWYTGSGSKDILIAASDGKLFSALPTDTAWTQIASGYQRSVWSWVTYEINPEGSEAPVDVLLLSNALDGMVMVRGDNLTVTAVPTPKKFGVIERYAERIWGAAIDDDPDMLVYSAPYDPTNWEANTEIPEDGAGDIMQPSWDGDSFTALRSFGSQLIAFKKQRVWRILGTDPGEYVFKEQFGGGAPYAATIAVDAERILMLSDRGVEQYDGLSVDPFQQEVVRDVYRRMNVAALDQATACLWRDEYIVALPLDDSTINNAALVYNMVDGTWLLRTDVKVESFLPSEDELYFTSSTTPGRLWKWSENSWETGIAATVPVKWVTPWTDLGRRDIGKSGFEVYLLCEAAEDVSLKISVQTEKKIKSKEYRVKAGNAEQKRLRFGGTGRRFRLTIESESGLWRLIGGLLVLLETDPD